jgi:beta-glucosidase
LQTELKGRLAFDGFAVSDWSATHSTVGSAMAGLDMEMGVERFYGKALVAAVRDGSVPEAVVDDKAERVLRTMIRVGVFDHPPAGNVEANVTSDAHRAIARKTAAAGTVLLLNDKVATTGERVLPLRSGAYTICVAGRAADEVAGLAGGGSGHVDGAHSVTYLEGIRARAAARVATVITPRDSTLTAATECATTSDVAVVCVGTWSHESQDRDSLALDQFDQTLFSYVLHKQKSTVLVLTSPGALLMPWLSGAYLAAPPPAALITFAPGQEAGHAMADLLWGEVNPSGRLPLTLPNRDNVPSLTPSMYPGVGPNASHLRSNYSDRLEVGYRWFHAHNVTPCFAFGHGRSEHQHSIRPHGGSSSLRMLSYATAGPTRHFPTRCQTAPRRARAPRSAVSASARVRALAGAAGLSRRLTSP